MDLLFTSLMIRYDNTYFHLQGFFLITFVINISCLARVDISRHNMFFSQLKATCNGAVVNVFVPCSFYFLSYLRHLFVTKEVFKIATSERLSLSTSFTLVVLQNGYETLTCCIFLLS